MINIKENKKEKAMKMRQRKPLVKNMNLEFIQQDLYEMQEACEDIRWYTDSEDGNDSLINALDGDEDEAYEFKMAFADLCAECERMWDDLREEWVPDCFDIFFVAVSNDNSELVGWDFYEEDYMPIGYSDNFIRGNACKKLKTMTKDNLIEAAMQCLKIYQAYTGLRSRYDNLKCAIDVLREQNTGYLQAVKEIERLYETASNPMNAGYEYTKASRDWKQYLDTLPPEAWVV